jgi:hypothetical protein
MIQIVSFSINDISMTFWYFYIFGWNLNITGLFNLSPSLSLSINDTSSISLSINDISMNLWYFYIFGWNLNMFPFCLWMFMRFFFCSFVFSNDQNYIILKYNRYHTNIKKNSYQFSILYFDNQNRGFLLAIFLFHTYFHSKLHLWEQIF